MKCLVLAGIHNLTALNFDNHATITVRCLTHWGRVTHIGVSKLTIIGSDNGLSPGRRQAIIWTNAGILLIGPLGTNFNKIFIEIHTFSFKKIHLKMSSRKWRPFCLGLNVLISSMISRIRHDVTHRCQNKIDAISQRKFFKSVSVNKNVVFWLKLHSQGSDWKWVCIASGNDFVLNRRNQCLNELYTTRMAHICTTRSLRINCWFWLTAVHHI